MKKPCHDWGRILCVGVVLFLGISTRAQNLFVSSYFNGTIVEITPQGVQSTFASGLPYINGLAFNSAGDLFVADSVQGNITEITPNGTQSIFASGLNYPVSLAFNSAGNLFVDNFSGDSITEITPTGVESTFASGLYYPQGMAFNSAGDLFVAQNADGYGSIVEIAPNGVQNTFASGLNPYGVAINGEGNLFEADEFESTINEFTPSKVESTFASNLYNVYNCITFDSAGNLYVAEYGTGAGYNGTIIKITPGGVESTFATGLYSPESLAFQPVPEPSGLVLMTVGAGLFFAGRRRNKR
jgi:sugar lactone lactonase YvrE